MLRGAVLAGVLVGTFLASPVGAAPRARTHAPKNHVALKRRASKPSTGAASAPSPVSAASPPAKKAGRTPEAAPTLTPSPVRSVTASPAGDHTPAPESATLPIPSTESTEAQRDRVVAQQPVPRHLVTIGLNPLPMIAGRYGLNVELVPVRHHGLVASAWVQTFTPAMLRVLMPSELDVSRGADARVGGELGYRVYTGADGAQGLFAGISGVAMPIAYPRVAQDLKPEIVSFHAYGGAIDVGVQAITSSGFTIGGGLGVMYLAYTPPESVTAPPGVRVPTLAEPHVLPRLLVAAGWSF